MIKRVKNEARQENREGQSQASVAVGELEGMERKR